MRILTINGGSSSVRFALFQEQRRLVWGKLERIGFPDSRLTVGSAVRDQDERLLGPLTQTSAVPTLIDYLAKRVGLNAVGAVGHRVVHGGPNYWQPQRITPTLLADLRNISSFDPEHMPAEIDWIDAFGHSCPDLPQVACFDTAFHHDMPHVARLLPIPRRLEAIGVRRYGFHGLSYSFLLEELARTAGPEVARGRIILAHLGNGASLAAVRDGHSIDTSMGFTPASGLPMSTRSGDLDPGLVSYLARTEGMTAEQFHDMVNRSSGLLGISETSSDMRDLLARRKSDPRAAEAIEFFCYQAKKWIGGFAAALGGLDTMVFSGGIGENAPEIRAQICEGLQFVGIQVDAGRNATNAAIVSTDSAAVCVRVIQTDEESVIAKAVLKVLAESV